MSDTYALPSLRDAGVLRDASKVMSSASTDAIRQAGEKLMAEFDRPVLLAWPREDRVFPFEHAQRYAARLRHARVVPIEDAYNFTPEDRPAELARAIADFASR